MQTLPNVLRTEIWEYVHGDRKHWQHRHFCLVLTELTKQVRRDDKPEDITAFRQHHFNNVSRLKSALRVHVDFPMTIHVSFGREYAEDGTKYWYASWGTDERGTTVSKHRHYTPGPARREFRRFMIIATEIMCGFRPFKL
jgi:hypothetical protein